MVKLWVQQLLCLPYIWFGQECRLTPRFICQCHLSRADGINEFNLYGHWLLSGVLGEVKNANSTGEEVLNAQS